MLCITRKPGTALCIGDRADGTLVTIHFGPNGGIAIDAPAHIRIRRAELPLPAAPIPPAIGNRQSAIGD